MNSDLIRKIAEACVDGMRGYSAEFSADPRQHIYEQDLAYQALLDLVAAEGIKVSIAEDMRPKMKIEIQERDDDSLLVIANSFPFARCIARRPKLVSNQEWRPTAELIVSALEAYPPNEDVSLGWFYDDAGSRRTYSDRHPVKSLGYDVDNVSAATPDLIVQHLETMQERVEAAEHQRDSVMHCNGLDWSKEQKAGYLSKLANFAGEQLDADGTTGPALPKIERTRALVDNLLRRSEEIEAMAEVLTSSSEASVAQTRAVLQIASKDNIKAAHSIVTLTSAVEAGTVALMSSMTAIDDWLNLYASELCDEVRVEEAKARVGAAGTLAYIADVQEANRIAMSEMSYRDKCSS